jgi:hypothetical protein
MPESQNISHADFQSCPPPVRVYRAKREKYAWKLIKAADSVTLLTVAECKAVIRRAIAGEFDEDIRRGL